jgi:hypothetical protein
MIAWLITLIMCIIFILIYRIPLSLIKWSLRNYKCLYFLPITLFINIKHQLI